MEVYCEDCRQTVGNVSDERIPRNKKAFVRCPHCSNKIYLSEQIKPETVEQNFVSENHISEEQASSSASPVAMEEQDTSSPMPTSDAAVPSQVQHYKLEFTGTAGEYFRIWIVNTFLTILTLGIYGAWAKVRTRRYFYTHTNLAGHSFEYLANPMAILKGNLIIGGGLILYYSANAYDPVFSSLLAIVFWLSMPFLVYKALRFYAHNSAFRNIRFRFLGTLGGSYKTYFLLPLAIPFTLGLIMPYWVFRRKDYFFNNVAFGTTNNTFSGLSGPFYRAYGMAALMFLGIIALAGTGIGAGIGASSFLKGVTSSGPETVGKAVFLIPIISYLAMLIIMTLMQQYLYARLTNYCWEQSRLGRIQFQSTIGVRNLLWIRLTNIAAIIFSLGLLVPWAKVRRVGYIIGNLAVVTEHNLDDFTAAVEPDESAYGDSAADFFDMEIGL